MSDPTRADPTPPLSYDELQAALERALATGIDVALQRLAEAQTDHAAYVRRTDHHIAQLLARLEVATRRSPLPSPQQMVRGPAGSRTLEMIGRLEGHCPANPLHPTALDLLIRDAATELVGQRASYLDIVRRAEQVWKEDQAALTTLAERLRQEADAWSTTAVAFPPDSAQFESARARGRQIHTLLQQVRPAVAVTP